MKASKKVVAAIAMATLLSTGVGAGKAFAYGTPAGFTTNTGTAVNGEGPSQKGKTSSTFKWLLKDLEGDIAVNGKFIKQVSHFPTPDKEGRYLQVTMPIELNYSYNVDNNSLYAPTTGITNESVRVKSSNGKMVVSPQPIKMTLVGLNAEASDPNIKYVDQVNPKSKKMQVPLELAITTKGAKQVGKYSFASLQREESKTIDVGAGANLVLHIQKIRNQNVANPNIEKPVSIKHNLKVRFEYNGE